MDSKTNKHEFACNAGKVTEYEVKEHIDTIMVGFRGFSKEVSIVKWNDKKPVFDIRACDAGYHIIVLGKDRYLEEAAIL